MIPAIVVSATAVACLLAIEWSGSTDWAGSKLVRAVAKMSAASAFLAMALACGALESTYGRLLIVALVSCWIGDACLLSSGRSRIFLAGIGAFLVGHLVFNVLKNSYVPAHHDAF